jgi:Ulp1 family protease
VLQIFHPTEVSKCSRPKPSCPPPAEKMPASDTLSLINVGNTDLTSIQLIDYINDAVVEFYSQTNYLILLILFKYYRAIYRYRVEEMPW